jgi:hypothetical protein
MLKFRGSDDAVCPIASANRPGDTAPFGTINMKKPTAIVVSVAALTVTLLSISSSAEARVHRHRHHYSTHALYYDYSYGNVQSPWTYIYPAANWEPFFHRVRHYGPVLPYWRATSWIVGSFVSDGGCCDARLVDQTPSIVSPRIHEYSSWD